MASPDRYLWWRERSPSTDRICGQGKSSGCSQCSPSRKMTLSLAKMPSMDVAAVSGRSSRSALSAVSDCRISSSVLE